jgi:glycerol kinase
VSDEGLFLAIDQGTSSTRAILYDLEGTALARADRALASRAVRPGWVEQSPTDILGSVVETVAEVLALAPPGRPVVAAGLANQGETVVAWDAASGEPLAPAVSWQCRRSEPIVARIAAAGHGPRVRELTGLPLDAYFSAGKMTWLLEHVDGVRQAARAGRLRLGTVDAWITARLGDEPITDLSTASRTQLLDVRALTWHPWLLDLFGVPDATLPRIVGTTGPLATLRHPGWPVQLALTAAACDQPAALVGDAGLVAGAAKATYGTGVFVVANAGDRPPDRTSLEASIGWRLANGTTAHILQGGVLSAGAFVRWLGDGLGLPLPLEDIGRLADEATDSAGIRILPALSGLGAPWFVPGARVVVSGLTGATRPAHVARAAIDAIAHRVCDIIDALAETSLDRDPAVRAVPALTELRVDGGLTRLVPLMQRQADLLGLPVAVVDDVESTARGIALLAACGAGRLDPAAVRPAPVSHRLEPRLSEHARMDERAAWQAFVERAAGL